METNVKTNDVTVNSYNDREFDIRISKILQSMGMTADFAGYTYAREAIKMCVTEPAMAHSIVRGVYRAVAEKYGKKAHCVERGIRHAIECIWERGNMGNIVKYFPCAERGAANAVSNGAFIANLADCIRVEWCDDAE